jgi:caffeoyl-CoA O-methyltransferase
MNLPTLLKRRTFLGRAAGALGLAPVAVAPLALRAAKAAESPSKPMDKKLEDLLTEMETKGRNMLSAPRKDGEFLRLMVKAVRAKNILEVGTSQGYSAIWMSLGLRETGGKLTTIEILPERVELAKKNLARAGLDKAVAFHQGDAHKIVSTLDGPFDFVLLDADKQGHVDYFNKLFPNKLTPGALVLSHNAIELKDMLEDYLKLVSNHPEFETVILSLTMEDGFAVSYRARA